jgi:hypothetical protein
MDAGDQELGACLSHEAPPIFVLVSDGSADSVTVEPDVVVNGAESRAQERFDTDPVDDAEAVSGQQ